jgi:hypothetical protein
MPRFKPAIAWSRPSLRAPVPPRLLTALVAVAAAVAVAVADTTNTDPWPAAPACSPAWPRASTAVADDRGRLWSADSQGRSCAFKNPADGSSPLPLEPWETLYACGGSPTAYTTKADSLGRLWGWDQHRSRSCAYKEEGKASRPRLYDGYSPGDWLSTPACPLPPPPASSGDDAPPMLGALDAMAVQDSNFRTWSWVASDASTAGAQLCAYKDDRQEPLPITPSDYKRLSFLDAPACRGGGGGGEGKPTPDNARPDERGFLWGSEDVRPCAWKRVEADDAKKVQATTPLYYDLYSGGPRTVEGEGPAETGGGGGGDEGGVSGRRRAERE